MTLYMLLDEIIEDEDSPLKLTYQTITRIKNQAVGSSISLDKSIQGAALKILDLFDQCENELSCVV